MERRRPACGLPRRLTMNCRFVHLHPLCLLYWPSRSQACCPGERLGRGPGFGQAETASRRSCRNRCPFVNGVTFAPPWLPGLSVVSRHWPGSPASRLSETVSQRPPRTSLPVSANSCPGITAHRRSPDAGLSSHQGGSLREKQATCTLSRNTSPETAQPNNVHALQRKYRRHCWPTAGPAYPGVNQAIRRLLTLARLDAHGGILVAASLPSMWPSPDQQYAAVIKSPQWPRKLAARTQASTWQRCRPAMNMLS